MKIGRGRIVLSLSEPSVHSQGKHRHFAVRVLGFKFQFCSLLAEQPYTSQVSDSSSVKMGTNRTNLTEIYKDQLNYL